ncbi:hypothetical protein HO111_09875 [Corynebacterium ulcerans]|uniref:hypothetical protein n=1 Tax=Corynebacterium silvaticum TaxID=2320431 RepID=UPI001123E1CA|nr:hypothetical protein [Corynebacterium silvaticum]NON70873.1 hypothetical protein [Corynebacterium silvaticum]TNX84329.1 hypothetical protein FIT55_07355 [Corynebacterium silvaticum]
MRGYRFHQGFSYKQNPSSISYYHQPRSNLGLGLLRGDIHYEDLDVGIKQEENTIRHAYV